MSAGRRGLVALGTSYAVAVAFAAAFSGSVVAPLTAVPVAIVGGLLAGYFWTRD